MGTAELHVKVRPMTMWDLQDIFSIDQEIRSAEPSVTYRDFTTQQIFGMSLDKSGTLKSPTVLEVAKLVELSFVAEVEGKICGFVVGRQRYVAEHESQEGEIAIIGVHPDYRGKGIATRLVNSICDLFHSRDVQKVLAIIYPQDKELSSFLERVGFNAEYRQHYTKMP